ncbi:helix-turn-helix domain-containing protein [Actinomyces minihominis]|uniref:AraC-like ligand-binding domain-containing protein n=1 Tax=Actinomyces minihominis TaxID=2002838 RepID=UPI000C073283|nr:helix-turn-helix domain-containing protein [Actinomyces minihominis]
MDLSQFKKALGDSFVPLDVEAQTAQTFRGQLQTHSSGKVHFTIVEGDSHTVIRTPSLISQGRENFYKVALQLEGGGHVAQGKREVSLNPGALTLYETGHPYTLELLDGSRTFVMMVPTSLVQIPRESVSELVTLRLDEAGSLGSLVTSHLHNLAASPGLISGPAGGQLTRGTLDLLLALLSGELAVRTVVVTPRQELFKEILYYLEDNLAQLDLTSQMVANAHFISIRTLQDLFQENGTTVSAWLRNQRLEKCREELLDPAHSDRSVGLIASRWGFQNPAHFSRVYRDKYDETPSQTRSKRWENLVVTH